MLKKITKAIVIYTIFYVIETVAFSVLLYLSSNAIQVDYNHFLLDQLTLRTYLIVEPLSIAVYYVQKIIESCSFAVLTSFVAQYIMNREDILIFPEKLVIRHRTSWDGRNKLTLGILLGNKSHFYIQNMTCTITCKYIKQVESILIVSEFTLSEKRTILDKFYRFSFDLTKFPRQILQDIIKKSEDYATGTISVCFTGTYNLDKTFTQVVSYRLSDIVFDEHIPNPSSVRKNIFTGNVLIAPFSRRTIKKIDWNEITRVVEVDENSRTDIVKEIKKIIRNIKKQDIYYNKLPQN